MSVADLIYKLLETRTIGYGLECTWTGGLKSTKSAYQDKKRVSENTETFLASIAYSWALVQIP